MKTTKKLLSLLLVFVIVCTSLVGYSSVLAETQANENQVSNIMSNSTTSSLSHGKNDNISLEEDTNVKIEGLKLPDIVKGDLSSSEYIARAKSKEKDLNTFVFKNKDGSQTMKVYSYPVKYIDEQGQVQDISTDIKANDNGTFETKANSIKTVFSKELKDGVMLQANNVNIRLVSDKAKNAILSSDKKTVTYTYDNKTTIEYSLTYTGFKEDIVVNEYTGQTEYEFTLYTNGLTLVKEYDSYFLKDSNGNIKATVGDIIIFTADDRNNALGDMTHETIIPSEKYVMTIHVDKEYLEDEKTKYPIRIDPTIEVVDINYDNNGAGAIEDVTISQNTTYGGSSGSLYIGRNADGTLSRALMRFPTLDISGIHQSHITSASIELKDLMCQDDEPMIIECRPYLNTAPSWSEAQTVTWSSVGTNYYGAVLDSHEVLYGHGNATNSGSIHRYSFDLTQLAREWAKGTQSAAKGIVLKATDSFEAQTGDSIQCWKKTFASYNRAANKPTFSLTYEPLISISMTEASVVEGNTLSLTASGVLDATFTWESVDESIATVDSNGLVTGVKAGRTIIVVSTTRNGETTSDECDLYVTVANGVYYIKNMNSNYYLHVETGAIYDCENVIQYPKYSNGIADEYKVRQQWKIYYLGNGYYSIRPMHNLNMGLDVTDDNVDIYSIDCDDTLSDVPSFAKWKIFYDGNGYVFTNNTWPNWYMQIENSSITFTASVIVASKDGSTSYKWSLEKITNPPSGILLYDMDDFELASGVIRYITPEETKDVLDLDLFAVAYSGGSIDQSVIEWYSGNENIACVDRDSGSITGVSQGTTTITAIAYSTSVSYTINVTAVANGTYYLRNWEFDTYADIEDKIMSNGTTIHQWGYHGGNTQRWIIAHLGDGYYTIRSANSATEYYMGVKDDSASDGQTVVLRTGTITNGMKWKIEQTTRGTYKITSKVGETNNRVLAIGWAVVGFEGSNGIDIEQRDYVDNDSYKDEWLLSRVSDVLSFEPQINGDFCWAACAKSLSTIFQKSQISQASGAVWAKLGVRNLYPSATQVANASSSTGTVTNIKDSIEYILGDKNVYGAEYKIYSESTMRSLLDIGNPIIALIGEYKTEQNIERKSGHAVIVYSYHFDETSNKCIFDIYDPLPVNEGKYIQKDYNDLCRGNYSISGAQTGTISVWEAIVIYKAGSYSDTIAWVGIN